MKPWQPPRLEPATALHTFAVSRVKVCHPQVSLDSSNGINVSCFARALSSAILGISRTWLVPIEKRFFPCSGLFVENDDQPINHEILEYPLFDPHRGFSKHSWAKVAICRSGFCDGSARERKPGMRRGLTEILRQETETNETELYIQHTLNDKFPCRCNSCFSFPTVSGYIFNWWFAC